MEIPCVSEDHGLTRVERRADKTDAGPALDPVRIIVFRHEFGALPHPAALVEPAPQRLGRDHEPSRGLQGHGQRGATPALAVPSEDSERIAQAVQRAGVYVALGCNEMGPRPEVQTIYNSLLFFTPDGTVLGRHRKLMPTFTECLFWGQGDARDLVVFDTDIGRLGGLICGEARSGRGLTLMSAPVVKRWGSPLSGS